MQRWWTIPTSLNSYDRSTAYQLSTYIVAYRKLRPLGDLTEMRGRLSLKGLASVGSRIYLDHLLRTENYIASHEYQSGYETKIVC